MLKIVKGEKGQELDFSHDEMIGFTFMVEGKEKTIFMFKGAFIKWLGEACINSSSPKDYLLAQSGVAEVV